MKKHAANLISCSRVVLLAPALLLIQTGKLGGILSGLSLIVLSFMLDAVDGYVARKLKSVNYLGSFFDLLFDRVTEIILFSWILLTPLQIPLAKIFIVLFFGRIIVVDYCRFRAYQVGLILPSGPKLFGLWKIINLSSISRGGYGAYKAIYFTTIICIFPLLNISLRIQNLATIILSVILIIFSFVRGTSIIAGLFGHSNGIIIKRVYCSKVSISLTAVLLIMDSCGVFLLLLGRT